MFVAQVPVVRTARACGGRRIQLDVPELPVGGRSHCGAEGAREEFSGVRLREAAR